MADQPTKTFYPLTNIAIGRDAESGQLTLEPKFLFNGKEHDGRNFSLTPDAAQMLINALQEGLELLSKQSPSVH
ncbi:hypothetical protein PPN31114_00226 [Pandoraea pneumonica]|uniref:Uncharacterized protein n=1 Tax=Pandoraea pneumonica TaxID=2508299 RepID=A0A5E4RM75_9BURK|nr:P2 family phage major capsid protein [Pandoraea pneumonica]VVD63522.1 hypothetical protein PPN31114_00226 [Pandoraea pneumonica]